MPTWHRMVSNAESCPLEAHSLVKERAEVTVSKPSRKKFRELVGIYISDPTCL